MQDVSQVLNAKIEKSQREGALNPYYWYKDNDCDAYIESAIRAELGGLVYDKSYFLENTHVEDGKNWHVLITPAVNGQTNVPKHALGIDYFLDKKHQANTMLAIFQLIYQNAKHNSDGSFSLNDQDLNNIIRKYDGNEETFSYITGVLSNCNFNSKQLNDYIELLKQHDQRDVFDEINDVLLDDGKAQHFKILSPCNLGIYDTYESYSGSHWILSEIQVVKQADNSCIVTVFGHDPLGGNGLSQENFKKIQSTVLRRLNEINPGQKNTCVFAQSPYEKRQIGGVDCGVYAGADLVLRAKGQPLKKYAVSAQELRNHQFVVTHRLTEDQKKLLISNVNIHPNRPNPRTNKPTFPTVKSSNVTPQTHRALPTPKPKVEDEATEKSKRNIGFVYSQLLALENSHVVIKDGHAVVVDNTHVGGEVFRIDVALEKLIETKWLFLQNNLVELKQSEMKFSKEAKIARNFLEEIDKDSKDSIFKSLGENEKTLLKDAIQCFKELSECTDAFPEITLEEIRPPQKADRDGIIKTLNLLQQKINDKHDVFAARVANCKWLTMNYAELDAIVNKIYPNKKNMTPVQELLGTITSIIEGKEDKVAKQTDMNSLSTPVQRLPRLALFSSEWLKNLNALGQSLEIVEKIHLKFKTEAKQAQEYLKKAAESSYEERLVINDFLRQSASFSSRPILDKSNVGSTESRAAFRGKPEELREFVVDVNDNSGPTSEPPERMPSSPLPIYQPISFVKIEVEGVEKPLNYACKAIEQIPENQDLSVVTKGLQDAINGLSNKDRYSASGFAKLSQNLAAIKDMMDKLEIAVPDQVMIQKVRSNLDNPMLGFVYAKLNEFVALINRGNMVEALEKLNDAWAGFHQMQDKNYVPHQFFNEKNEPIEQSGNLSLAQRLFNEAFRFKQAIKANGFQHDNGIIVGDLQLILSEHKNAVLIPGPLESAALKKNLPVTQESAQVEDLELRESVEKITDPTILEKMLENLMASIFERLAQLNLEEKSIEAKRAHLYYTLRLFYQMQMSAQYGKKLLGDSIEFKYQFFADNDINKPIKQVAQENQKLLYIQELFNFALTQKANLENSDYKPKAPSSLSDKESYNLHQYILSFICQRLQDYLSLDHLSDKSKALEDVWKAFYILQIKAVSVGIYYFFFDVKQGNRPQRQTGGNLTFAQELFNGVLSLLSQQQMDKATLINLRGILSKQTENDIPQYSTTFTEDNFMQLTTQLTPKPQTSATSISGTQTPTHGLAHNDLEVAVLGMAMAIVSGCFDIQGDPSNSVNIEKQKAQKKWKQLFNANKVGGRDNWEFDEIKDYFTNLDTYQAQQEALEQFAILFRKEAKLKTQKINEYKDDTVDIESDFDAYFTARINNMPYDSDFVHCPAVKSYYETICREAAGKAGHPLVGDYFSSLNKDPNLARQHSAGLTKRVRLEWSKSLAGKFIEYTEKNNASIGRKRLANLCANYGFNIVFEKVLQTNPHTAQATIALMQENVLSSHLTLQSTTDWLREAPSAVEYQIPRPESAPGAYWPSMHIVTTKVKAQGQETTWILAEPENASAKVINAQKVAAGLREKINQNSGKAILRVEAALLDLFEKYASHDIVLVKGEINEEFRTAYLAYQNCRNRGEEFIFSETYKITLLNRYLKHVEQGLLPLTDKLVAAWTASLGKHYIIWKKQTNCTIQPCDSSLSDSVTKPSKHILQTEDENGNTVFKEMEAEEVSYLEYAPVYQISESNIVVPEGTFYDNRQLLSQKFYNTNKILAKIQLLMHFQTRDSNQYNLYLGIGVVGANIPWGDIYGLEIRNQVNLIDELFNNTIRSLEEVARSGELAGHLLGGNNVSNSQKDPAKDFSVLIHKIKLLWEIFRKIKNLGFVGNGEHPVIEEAKRLIAEVTGRPFYDPYERKTQTSQDSFLPNIDTEGEHPILNPNLEHTYFTVRTQGVDAGYKPKQVVYTVHKDADIVNLEVAPDAFPALMRKVYFGSAWLINEGLTAWGGYQLGNELGNFLRQDDDGIRAWEIGTSIGLTFTMAAIGAFTYWKGAKPHVWVKEQITTEHAFTPTSYEITQEYQEYLPEEVEPQLGNTSLPASETGQQGNFNRQGLNVNTNMMNMSGQGRGFQVDNPDGAFTLDGAKAVLDSLADLLGLLQTDQTLGLDGETQLLAKKMLDEMPHLQQNPALFPDLSQSYQQLLTLVQVDESTGSKRLNLLQPAKALTAALQSMVAGIKLFLPAVDMQKIDFVDRRGKPDHEINRAMNRRAQQLQNAFRGFEPTAKKAILERNQDTINQIEALLKNASPQSPVSAEKLDGLFLILEDDVFIKAAMQGINPVNDDTASQPLDDVQVSNADVDISLDSDEFPLTQTGGNINSPPTSYVVTPVKFGQQITGLGSPLHTPQPTVNVRPLPQLKKPGEGDPLLASQYQAKK